MLLRALSGTEKCACFFRGYTGLRGLAGLNLTRPSELCVKHRILITDVRPGFLLRPFHFHICEAVFRSYDVVSGGFVVLPPQFILFPRRFSARAPGASLGARKPALTAAAKARLVFSSIRVR